MSNYTTQMDAARKGIVTPEIEKVAKKEKTIQGAGEARSICGKGRSIQ